MHIRILKPFTTLGGITYQPSAKGEHVATSVAESWFQDKLAEPFKYKSAAERLAVEESLRNPAKPAAAAVWTVRVMPHSQKLVVQYDHCGTQIVYGAIVREFGKVDHKQFVGVLKSAKCPESVISQWLEAAKRPDYLQLEADKFDADRRAAAQQREREKHAPRFI